MMARLVVTILLPLLWLSGAARAQAPLDGGAAWIQIEAQPTLAEAEARARAYAGVFPDIAGYRLRSGWYAILIGPYSAESAPARLDALQAERLIPGDSYLTDAGTFRDRFWPAGVADLPTVPDPLDDLLLPDDPLMPDDRAAGDPAAGAPAAGAPVGPGIVTDPIVQSPLTPGAPIPDTIPPDTIVPLEPDLGIADPVAPAPVVPEETPAEARATEALLDRPTRQALQTALAWFGHYTSTIDGAFGAGTRTSMAAWQAANGAEPTGILTTAQRGTLLQAFEASRAELGMDLVTEPESGIEIALPLALVRFDHYEPPFVHYAPRDGSGAKVILISQPGDQAALSGLYDVLQTLAEVPTGGPRERTESGFTISGRNATVASETEVVLSKGLVKGWMLVWNPRDDARMDRVLAAMRASFRPVGNRALDPGLVPMPETQRRGLLAGLEVRRPKLSRSGFYVDAAGTVVTTTEAIGECGRITLDETVEATVAATDAAGGMALLRPSKPLSPPAIARIATAPARLGGEIAVAGYSFGDALPAAALTFGRLEEAQGLDGEPGVLRLTLGALPGDAGGPVLDQGGMVVGMLRPAGPATDRQLPPGIAFATGAGALAAMLERVGVMPPAAEPAASLPPDDLNGLARGMTVLVSCWD